jgi:hypothetical protein
MPRLYQFLRAFAVAIVFPAIACYLVLAMGVHALRALVRKPRSQRAGILHVPLRLWMNLVDWIRGMPVGYSYWEQYQAPVMLDEIAVHHDE